jgi:hypothetical protein
MRAVIALGSLLSLTSPTLSQTPAPGDPVVSLTRLATCQGVNAHQETIAATFDSAAAAAQARRAEALDQLYEETIVRAIAAAIARPAVGDAATSRRRDLCSDPPAPDPGVQGGCRRL